MPTPPSDRPQRFVGVRVSRLREAAADPVHACLVGIGSIPPQKRTETEEVMKSVRVPPEGGTLRTGEPFNCRMWLKLAVGALQKEGVLDLPLHIGE